MKRPLTTWPAAELTCDSVRSAMRHKAGSPSTVVKRPEPFRSKAPCKYALEIPIQVPSSRMLVAAWVRANLNRSRPQEGDTDARRTSRATETTPDPLGPLPKSTRSMIRSSDLRRREQSSILSRVARSSAEKERAETVLHFSPAGPFKCRPRTRSNVLNPGSTGLFENQTQGFLNRIHRMDGNVARTVRRGALGRNERMPETEA